MPEALARQSFATIASGVGTNLDSITSIVISGDATLLYYDHWEDGYETDLAHPTQATTLVWGDGNDANGIPPGFTHDLVSFTNGTVLTLRNNVTVPRNPATRLYDGRDRVAATKAVVITRAMWPTTPGSVLGGSVAVQSTLDFGTNFVSPVGQDMTNKLFTYVGMSVMAAQDGTVVTINTNVNGGTPFAVTLNQGESYLINGGFRKGGTVSSSKPIEADLIIGHVGASYAADWFTLYSSAQWSSSYQTPVGSASGNPTFTYVYNPNPTNVTVSYNTMVSSGTFVVSNGGCYQFQMPVNSGARLASTNGASLIVLSTAGANPSSDTAYNWGFTPLSDSELTTVAVVGWGAGSSDGTVNGSPVWVTAAKATTVYVDYHGDRNGALTDRYGQKYDTNFTIAAFQSLRIYDPSKDQTAMRIYTVDGTPISVAWGEDPSVAAPGNPYLDLGTTVLPFPVPIITKSVAEYSDSGASGFTVGDIIKYTVEVDNKGLLPLGNLVVVDAPPTNLAYLAGSTTRDGVPVPDDITSTPFPLDSPGYTIPMILRGGSSTFTYLCTIVAAGAITNTVSAAAFNVTAQTIVTTPATNAPAPQCAVNFKDAAGRTTSSYAVGGSIYVTLTNAAANTSSNSVQTTAAVVQDPTSGDYEVVTLTETGNNTGVFTSAALTTSTTSGLGPNDGTLYVAAGDSLLISYTDPTYGSSSTATATIVAPSLTKVLYLSGTNAPDQSLDRIDPAATSDTTTAQTAILGPTTYQTIGVDNTTSGNNTASNLSYTLGHTVGTGPNRLLLVGLSYATNSGGGTLTTNVTYGGVALTLVTNWNNTSSSSIYKPRSEIWMLVNPTPGTANLIVKYSRASTNLNVGIMTFTNVDQTTPIGSKARSSSTSSSSTPTVTVSSDANSLVLGVLAAETTTYTETGQTNQWNQTTLNIRGVGSTKAGAASVQVSWSGAASKRYAATAVSIRAASTSTPAATFTQTTNFCTPFIMPQAGALLVTNYVSLASGSLPANPAVTASLKHGTTTFATLNNPTVTLLSGGTTINVVGAAVSTNAGNVSSLTSSYDSGSTGTNRILLVGISYRNSTSSRTVSSVTYNTQALTRWGTAANGSSAVMYIYARTNPPTGANNLVVNWSGGLSYGAVIGAVTYAGVNQTTPTNSSGFVSTNGTSTTPATPAITSAAGQVVFGVVAGRTTGIYTNTATGLWSASANSGNTAGAGQSQDGSSSVTSSWTGSPSAAWVAGEVSLQPAPVYPATYQLDWTTTLGSAVTVPSGEAISLTVSNGSGTPFSILYDSTTNASKVVLPTTTVISAQSIGIYDAPYPGGGLQSAPNNGQTLYARVVVSDPFGSYDISSVGLVIDGPGTADDISTTLTSASIVNDTGCARTYEYVWRTGSTVGGYTITATAHEGTEGVSNSASTGVVMNFLDLGTPSTTEFTSGNNGPRTNNFETNSTAWVRVTDMNRNTNSTTAQTVTATVTSSSGDSELVTLTETGPNTGVFTNGIPLINPASDHNSGSLTATQGSVIQVTYTDATDPADVTTDTATIPMPAGTGGIRVTATLLTASPTSVGNTVQFSLQVVNTGSTNLPTVTLTNSFPTNALTFVSASLAPTAVVAGTNLTWSNLGPLTPGQSTNIVLTFTASGSAAPATAAATVNGGAVSGSASATVTVTRPALVVTKTKLSPTNDVVSIGSNVVFQIVITNSGDTAVSTLPLQDDYSAATFQYVSATIPPDGSGGGTLIWNNLATNSLAAGATITNLVTMKVVGQGYPAYNTAHSDFAADANNNAVPATSSTASVTNSAARLTGLAYNDKDQNGTLTAGDVGLANVTIQLYTDPNGDGNPSDGALVGITMTDGGGYYELLNLSTNNYVIIESDPDGYTSSAPVNNRLALNVNSLATFSNNYFFDYVVVVANYASVSGHAWFDSNQSGAHDAGEPGVTNAFLELVQDVNTNGLADLGEPVVAAAYTDTNGLFTFSGVVPGNYVIRETDFFGWASTADSQGANDNQVGVTLGAGASVSNVWFLDYSAGGADGYFPPVAAPDSYTVLEDMVLTATSTNGILANDFCTTGISNLTAMLVANTTNGTLTLNTNTGAFTYTPNASFFGTDAFTYQVKDAAYNTSAIAAVTLTVLSVNNPPTFTAGANLTGLEDSATRSVANWATGISVGPANESTQTVGFVVRNNNNNMFSAQPAVSSTGTLTYTPATNVYGTATVTIYVQDNGGTANGGVDVSATNTFTITLTAVNDPPSFDLSTNDVVVLESAGGQTDANLLTNLSVGPANESAQTLTFFVSNSHSNLFTVQPTISADGTLTFTAVGYSNGVATLTVYTQDSGGTDNGGIDVSATNTFTITVISVNNPPTLTPIGNQSILEDAGTQTVNLSGISPGPSNESGQTLTLTATSSNPGLVPNPTIDYINGNTTGTLTYAPVANSNGVATITVVAQDNGGTAHGGSDRTTNTFTVTVTSVNDAPSFGAGFDLSVNQKAGAQTFVNWATEIRAGPPNESSQTVTFVVTNSGNNLFTVQPQLSSSGTLTFTPATDGNGVATVTVVAHDDGGTDDGGVITSAPQTFTIAVGASELIRATGGEAISADTVGGAWTLLSGPTYVEGLSGAAGAGTIILSIPTGFEFDTGGVAPTVLIERNGGSGPDSLNINGATTGQAFAVTSVTSTQITFTITTASSGLVMDTLTWQNLRVRPTNHILPSGDRVITSSGTAVIQQVQAGATSWGNPTEVAGSSTQLGIGAEPSATATAGAAFARQPIVWVEDAYGNLVTTASGTVTAVRNAGSGTLQGTLTATIGNGVATFPNLYHNVATNITISFSSGSLTPVTSSVVAISAATADHLVMVGGNYQTNTVATAVSVNPTVRVVDAFGNPALGANVTFTVQSGGGHVGAGMVASGADGLAATTYTLGTAAGANNNTMQAAVSGLPGAPTNLTFTESATPDVAAQLAIQTEPSDTATAGAVFARQPAVVVEDQYDNVVPSASGLTITAARSAGSGNLLGDLLEGTTNGVATFNGLYHNVATNITVVFSSPGLTSVSSAVITISSASADHLAMVQGDNQTNPVHTTLPINPTVQVLDAFGNPVQDATVTFAVQAGGGNAGTPTVASDAHGLTATTYTLGTVVGTSNNTMLASAAVPGNPNNVLFTASALVGAAAKLGVHTEPSAIATAGVNFAQQPVIWVEDAYGNPVTNASGVVSATRNSGSGTLQGTPVATIVNGVATFTDLHHNVAGDTTINFTSGSLAPATSTVVSVQTAAADHLVLAQGDNQTNTVATALPVNAAVEVVDAFGNPVSGVSVSFAVETGGGHIGTATVTSGTNGLATTTYILGTSAGTSNNTLRASATVAGSPSSLTFTESASAGRASQLAVYTEPSSTATAGVAFNQQPVVCVEDFYGNIVTTASGTVTVVREAGSGDLQGAVTATLVNGFATFTDLNHQVATTITLTFTSSILSPVTSIAIEVSAAGEDHLVMITGDGQIGTRNTALAVALKVQVVDSFGNPVSGSSVTFTPSSGSASPTSANSDVNGMVATVFTLPNAIGNVTVDAALGVLDSVQFTETAGTAVNAADIATTMTGPSVVGINQQLTYTITVTNAGPNNAANVVVTNTLPAGVTLVSAPGAAGTDSAEVWWNIGTLNNSASSTLTLTVTAPATVGTLNNNVFSVSSTYDPQLGNNDGAAASATVATAVQSADVQATITGPTSAIAGINLTFTVLVTNLGPSTAAGVWLTNTVPVGFAIVDAAGGTINGQIVIWNIGSLASGGWNSFILTLTPPTSGGTYINTLASSATTYDPVALNNNETGAGGSVTTVVTPLNAAPTITAISNQTVNESAGQQTVPLTGIGPGTSGAGQMVTNVTATSSDPGLIPNPTIGYSNGNTTGTLTYTPAPYSNGVVTITVVVQDNAGTVNGGIDKNTNTFTITVNAVNDPPSFTKGGNQTGNEDVGPQTVTRWATAISPGPPNESSQTVTFHLSNNNNALFTAQPAVSSAGALTFTPAANANGSATVTIYAQDNGGPSNGGVDVSAATTFTITVHPVNDPPSFTLLTNNVVVASGAQSILLATNISAGPVNESDQHVTFLVGNPNHSLFSVQPAISTNGTLTFTAADNMFGTVTVTVYAQDGGGTANGGVDTSAPQTFTLTIARLKLTFTTQPGGGTGGTAWSQQPVVRLEDESGNPVLGLAQNVTLTIQNNAGPGGTISGTVTMAVDTATGLATFSGLSIDKIGSGYTLTATGSTVNTSPGVLISSAFAVTVGSASAYRITDAAGETPTAGVGDQLAITLVDAGGNTVGYSGTKTLTFSGLSTAGDGTHPTVTDQNGGATNLGSSETIAFVNGGCSSANGAAVLKAYKAEGTVTLNVSDPGGMSSTSPGGAGVSLTIANVSPVANPFTYARNASAGFRLSAATLLTHASDANHDSITLASVTTPSFNGATVRLYSGFVIYTPPISASSNATDHFDYTVSDGIATATATITITTTTTYGTAVGITNGVAGVTVTFAGIPGFNYVIERAPDVNEGPWTTLLNTNAPANGLFSYTDTDPPSPTGYYRTRTP